MRSFLDIIGFCILGLLIFIGSGTVFSLAAIKANATPPTKSPFQTAYDCSASVFVNETGCGSGIIIKRDHDTYVLTAAHVIRAIMHAQQNEDGTVTVSFDTPRVVKTVSSEQHIQVHHDEYTTKILRYSCCFNGEDLAVLKVDDKDWGDDSTEFGSSKPVKLGTQLWHFGTFMGQESTRSFSQLFQAGIGRRLDNSYLDQTSGPIFPGSSGGPLFTTDGKCVGMVVQGHAKYNTIGWYIPNRKIFKWLDKVGMKFLYNDRTPIPTEEELNKYSIFDVEPALADLTPLMEFIK